jgi:O-acetyl-ADP-ribose deacetylase (regulator of RNase III)
MMTAVQRVEAVRGDITKLDVDAVVNAANRTLLGGGGVDGCIHRAAGPKLLAMCATLGGCRTGEAKITPGYRLPARHVIHAVGPVWRGGERGEADLLAGCYRRSLELAVRHGLETIAFPCISTGVYGYPKAEACRIAIETTLAFLDSHPEIRKVLFVCFGEADLDVYRQTLDTHREDGSATPRPAGAGKRELK